MTTRCYEQGSSCYVISRHSTGQSTWPRHSNFIYFFFFCLNVLRICTRGSIFYFPSCLRAGMDGPLQGGDVPKFLVVQAGLWLQCPLPCCSHPGFDFKPRQPSFITACSPRSRGSGVGTLARPRGQFSLPGGGMGVHSLFLLPFSNVCNSQPARKQRAHPHCSQPPLLAMEAEPKFSHLTNNKRSLYISLHTFCRFVESMPGTCSWLVERPSIARCVGERDWRSH